MILPTWRRYRGAATLIGLALLSGCAAPPKSGPSYFTSTDSDATVFVNPNVSGIQQIAVLPFKAPTELIGSSVSELFVTEILMSRRYRLVERSQIDKVFGESELAMSGMTTSKAAEIGNLVGADAVVIGTVDQYETKAHKGSTYPVIGITLRMIECKSSRIGWSVDLAKQATDKRASLSTHAREIVHEMMAGLYGQLLKYDPPPTPTGIQVSDMGLQSATISWHRPQNRKVTYMVERADKREGPFSSIARIAAGSGRVIDRGLKDAETYYYRVTAVTANQVQSAPSETLETFTAPPPAPPAKVEASQDLVGSIVISWTTPPETTYVKGYRVERAEEQDGPYSTVKTLTGVKACTYVDGGREPGKLDTDAQHAYRIITVNDANVASAPSVVVTGRARAEPPVVEALAGESNRAREVPLTWGVSPDTKVAGYHIFRSDDEGAAYERIQVVKGREHGQWIDRGTARRSSAIGELSDGHTYLYKIVAYNIGDVLSPETPPVVVSTKPAPATPADLVANDNGVCEVELSWSANSERDITGYRVEMADEANDRFKPVTVVNEPAFTVNALEHGQTYFFRIVAIDQDTLESGPSTSVSATTKPCPDPPTEITAEVLPNGSAFLTWQRPAQSDITGYTVFKKSTFSRTLLGETEEPLLVLQPAQIGKRLIVYVIAKNEDNQTSQPSQTCDVRPPPAANP